MSLELKLKVLIRIKSDNHRFQVFMKGTTYVLGVLKVDETRDWLKEWVEQGYWRLSDYNGPQN